MSGVSLPYREEQRWDRGWARLLRTLAGVLAVAMLAVTAATGQWDELPAVVLGPLVLLGLAWLFDASRLVVDVDDREVRVALRYFWPTRRIPLADVVGVEVRSFSGFWEYGGWGARLGPKGWAYMVGGNEGVQLRLAKGRPVLIGSSRPRDLAAAIEAAQRTRSGA